MRKMFASIKNFFKRKTNKILEIRTEPPFIICGFVGLLEDILFWQNIWFSWCFIFIFNIFFFLCVHQQIGLFGFILAMSITVMIVDAFESWLKHKHRTSLLRRLGSHDGQRLKTATQQLNWWLYRQWAEFVHLRETNHTKAFILANICLGLIFITGKYINGYILIYVFTMFLCVTHKIVFPVLKVFKNFQQDLESECEYEGLIPEISDLDIKLLSIEPEHNQNYDDKQHYDYWKPDDIPFEEGSDSSENSSSLVTSFSMDKIQTLEKDVQSSDSSEDEYIPLDQPKESQLKTTIQLVDTPSTWSSSAYSALWNFTGAVASMMQTDASKRKRVSSIDSSDGFEMIDQHDLS